MPDPGLAHKRSETGVWVSLKYDPVDSSSKSPLASPMPDRSRKRPRDINQLAATIVAIATGSATEKPDFTTGKNPAAVALGRLGGKRGGKARADSLTAEQRSDIARKAAQARYGKKP